MDFERWSQVFPGCVGIRKVLKAVSGMLDVRVGDHRRGPLAATPTMQARNGNNFLLFITAVPNTKLCAWGEEDSGGHVPRLRDAESERVRVEACVD